MRVVLAFVSAWVILALFSTPRAQPTSTVFSDGTGTDSPLAGQLEEVFNPLQTGATSSALRLAQHSSSADHRGVVNAMEPAGLAP